MAENVTYREAFQRFDRLLEAVEKEGRSYVIHDGERPLCALVPVEAPQPLGVDLTNRTDLALAGPLPR